MWKLHVHFMSCTFLHFQDGTSPLYVACQENHGEIVDCLLLAKADVNLQRKVGMTYIYHTVRYTWDFGTLHVEHLLPPWAYTGVVKHLCGLNPMWDALS